MGLLLFVALAQAGVQPERFAASVISDANEQWRLTFTPDGLGPGVNTQPSAADPHPQAAWDLNPEISRDATRLLLPRGRR